MNTVEEILTSWHQKVETWISTFLSMLPNLAVAFLVLLAFYLAARISRKLFGRLLKRFSYNQLVVSFLGNLVFVILIMVGFITAMGILHLEKTVTSFLAGAGILGLAIGFAFQDIVSNFISGVLIAFYKPFEVGHIIRTKDYKGMVRAINLRNTLLDTGEGERVIIPNKDIVQNALVNFSVYPMNRGVLSIRVATSYSTEKLEDECKKAIESVKGVDTSKPVELHFVRVGKDYLHFQLVYWFRSLNGESPEAFKSRLFIGVRQQLSNEGLVVG